ncbi:hypothetical protein KBD81_02625 [Candidatus Woesebacteria bacterium]|nr:hypothetical protein [Candidatus Woesebacteria bacterium]
MSQKIEGFGINVDINHFDEKSIDILIETILKIKARWVRLEICSNKYKEQDNLRALLMFTQKCHKKNIVVSVLFSDFVPLTFLNLFFPQKTYVPVIDRVEAYEKFVQHVVELLSGYVNHWEIWNEQNSKRFWIKSPSLDSYLIFLRRITVIIRAYQKDATIIFGGIFGNDVSPLYPPFIDSILLQKGFIQEALSQGAGEIVDFFAIHPYTRQCFITTSGHERVSESIIEKIEEARKVYSHIPLLVTEIGVSPLLNLRVGPREVALIYQKLLKYSESTQLPLCIYALADQQGNLYGKLNPDRDFGFLDYDLNPKPLLNEFLQLL